MTLFPPLQRQLIRTVLELEVETHRIRTFFLLFPVKSSLLLIHYY
ncbi:hypothetical protein COO91_10852 (plasmid) [Nostoc flagelliforme CCNUN1]|uniref:Uncharacterized protein n=1 Tax=Nostoc flagelliforme CCNUN1 TaxID=2038116 RepID=A0A2K8TA93_9NOSO|nr:hypothetical protein COO91_10852 [Nostoc flagelliforme CCNUN1]